MPKPIRSNHSVPSVTQKGCDQQHKSYLVAEAGEICIDFFLCAAFELIFSRVAELIKLEES